MKTLKKTSAKLESYKPSPILLYAHAKSPSSRRSPGISDFAGRVHVKVLYERI